MANSPQAKKRARQSIKRRNHNMTQRTQMRTILKKALKAIQSGDKTAANAECKIATRALDMAASHNIIHKNKAARLKSRLIAKLKKVA